MRKAFTLIELLVVVSIIALLIAILLPALGSARESARAALCLSNVRQTATANELYADEGKGKYVYNYLYTAASHGVDNWQLSINGTLGNAKYWSIDQDYLEMMGFTDAQLSNLLDPSSNNWGVTWPSEFNCPTWVKVPSKWDHRMSYGYNRQINRTAYKRDQITSPSDTYQFTDSQSWWTKASSADYEKFWDQDGEEVAHIGSEEGLKYRHNEGASFSFFDAHAEYRKKEEVWDVNYNANHKNNADPWEPYR